MHRGERLQVERRERSDGYALSVWDVTPDGSGSPPHRHSRLQRAGDNKRRSNAREGYSADVDRLG